MVKKTHIAGGLVVSAIARNGPIGIAASIFGALLPDIDLPSSTMGKKVKIIGKLLEHRGFTHSLLFMFIVYGLLRLLEKGQWFDAELYMIVPGILSHIVLDMLNTKGVKLLYPFNDKIKIPLIKIKTGTWSDSLCFCILIILTIGLWFFPQ